MFAGLVLALIALTPTGNVNDFAHLLKPETISNLEIALSNFERDSGNELAVVTIEKLPNTETIETYAEKLFREWGIGKEKEDNGLLLLISRDDREMRIEVGYGLEPIITDIESGSIIREILVPAFKSDDYDGGIQQATERIMDDIGRGEPQAVSQPTGFPFSLDFIYLGLILLMFLSSILARSKSWWLGGVIGAGAGFVFFSSLLYIGLLAVIGLIFDYVVSKTYKKSKASGINPPWWIGGPGGGLGGGSGGGFGGFGGGSSGGGGASGRW